MPQELSYRVNLPDGKQGRFVVQARPAPGRAQVVRVSGSGVGRPTESVVEVDEIGFVTMGRMQEENGPVREALLRDGSYLVRDAGGEGTLPLNRPLLTAVDLVSWLGKRVGRKPTYFWFLAYDRNALPRLDSALVETLPTPPTERRLRVTLTDLRDGSRRVGDIRIDPATGAVAEVGPPLAETPLRLIRRPFEDPPGQRILTYNGGYLVRATPEGDGFQLRLLQDGRLRSESVRTDASLAPTQVSHKVEGRAIAATVADNRVVWQVVSGPSVRVPTLGDQTWFPPHLLATRLWEERGYFSVAPGQKREGTLLLALPEPEPFTLGRFVDEGTSRRYRLVSKNLDYDLTTDGNRLIRLASPTGLSIVRA